MCRRRYSPSTWYVGLPSLTATHCVFPLTVLRRLTMSLHSPIVCLLASYWPHFSMTVRYWPPTDLISLWLYVISLLLTSFLHHCKLLASYRRHFCNCTLLASHRRHFSNSVRYWPPLDVISPSLYVIGLIQTSFLHHCTLLASYRRHFCITVRYWPPTDVISLTLYVIGLLQTSFLYHCMLLASDRRHFSLTVWYRPPIHFISLTLYVTGLLQRPLISLTVCYWPPTEAISPSLYFIGFLQTFL